MNSKPNGRKADRKLQYGSFGKRLRAARKERQMTLSEFAEILGTTKQALSRYERDQSEPTIRVVQRFAEKLNVSVEYLIKGNEFDLICDEVCEDLQAKPFYEVFVDVVHKRLGLKDSDVAEITGLTKHQIQAIVTHRMRYAPLDLAVLLSETLNVPVEVWSGDSARKQTEMSEDARKIARMYDAATEREKSIVRYALDL